MSQPAKTIDPELAALTREAEQHLGARRLAPAQQACLRILQIDRSHADAHFLLGVIAAEAGKPANAVEFFDVAIEFDAARADFHAQRARSLAMLKRDAEAREAVDAARQLEPSDALTLDTLGVVLSRVGDHAGAANLFRRAAKKAPRNPGYQFNLASSLTFAGNFDGAEQAYEAAIDLSPRFYKAHAGLSRLRRQTPERNHVKRLEGLLHGAPDVDAELQLRHALAKELDDLGEHDAAFEHLAAGNRRKRASLDYDVSNDETLFELTRRCFDTEWFARDSVGHASPEPIFIIGMPRTGTTLVERIVSSHTHVDSAGELQNLPIAIKRLAGTPSRDVFDADTIKAAVSIDPRDIGQRYIESTRPGTGRSPHFVDKMPLNYFYAGLIHKALPNAKILCLRRHPLDTCLSNFRQLFALNFSYYNYAYDLGDIARYFVAFDTLIRHWRNEMTNGFLEIDYETLVANQERESRRIIGFCGLDWEPACLAFERNESAVATASAAQVREPMNTRAVARWRRYEQHLAPILPILQNAGIELEP